MASKRKKSRPTKIAKVTIDSSLNQDEYLELGSIVEEDPMTRIQRFIEEGSEDTPDACQERSKCSIKKLVSKATAPFSAVPSDRGLNFDVDRFSDTFTNGHIPANLKFHQLKKEEIESIETPQVNAIGPVVAPKKLPTKRAKPSDDDTPRYSCSMCKYVTNRSDHYKRHLMTHSADKPLKCVMCSYGTGRSDHYKRHLQRHGLSEQEVIDTCFRNGLKLKNTSISSSSDCSGKPKESKENVQQPDQSNSCDNPSKMTSYGRFKCESCNYSTDKSSLLNRHRNSHTKINQTHSKKSLKALSSSQQQLQRTGERAQRRCEDCSLTFIDRPSLLRHMKNKHQGFLDMGETADLKNNTSDNITASVEFALPEAEKSPPTPSNVHVIEDSSQVINLTSKVQEMSSDISTIADVDPDVIFVGENHEKTEDGSENSDDSQQTTGFMPSVPSAGANLGCTKCGNWFNKFNEYSSHTCVS